MPSTERAKIIVATSRAVKNRLPHIPVLPGPDEMGKLSDLFRLKSQQIKFLKACDTLKDLLQTILFVRSGIEMNSICSKSLKNLDIFLLEMTV